MEDLIRSNGFGPFHCQGVEILRRVVVTVRDRDWREISPTHWNCKVNEALQATTVEARHASELVDFVWQGNLEVGAEGRSLSFAFEGEVQRTMDVCRLGLIVLHPVETMVGARITARGPDGQETLVVARTIAPQPIIEGMPAAMMQPFSSLIIERADMGSIDLRFGGDLFEIEDQRNWGDATFKTYCTPLKKGFPREILKGTRIAHRFELRFSPPIVPLTASANQMPRGTTRGIFPTIGRISPEPSSLVSQELQWRHLHVDLSHADDLAALKVGLDHQPLPLEIGMQDYGCDDHRASLVSWMALHNRRILRVLLYGEGMSPPSAVRIANWRRALDAVGAADLPLFAATRGYFVEFNRSGERPTGALSGFSFPLTATVHADDPRTIAENVATIRDIAATARHLTHSPSLSIAPLALYYPPSLASTFPREMIAPWLAATLMYAAAAGATSVTLANDVVSMAPVSLLDRLLQCADHAVTLLLNEQPNHVHAAVLHRPGQTTAQILAINLNSVPAHFQLKAFAECVRLLRNESDDLAVNTDGTRMEIPACGVCWLKCEPY
jgi:hypothetical protein